MPAARLRAAIWQSIFTHDIARYRRSLFEKMSDLTTLITGLKQLQGLVWRHGYEAGEITGQVFADVPAAFAAWTMYPA